MGKNTDLTRKVNNLRKIISEFPDRRNFIVLKNKEGKEILCAYAEQECQEFKKGKEVYKQELDLKKSFGEDGKKKYNKVLVGVHEREIEPKEANPMMDKLLHEVYDVVIKPIEEAGFMKSKSIVISPDNVLFTIPFSALKNEKGEYLVKDYEISLIHSASIWERLLRKEEVTYNIPTEHIYLGIRANKDELYKKFERPKEFYRTVLFSVHGILDMESPELNSLLLTSRERAVKYKVEELDKYEKVNGKLTRDGSFKLGETIELGIKTDLLSMSACQTSLGTEKAGEGDPFYWSPFVVYGR